MHLCHYCTQKKTTTTHYGGDDNDETNSNGKSNDATNSKSNGVFPSICSLLEKYPLWPALQQEYKR